jgi:hypothetical protein
MRDTEIVHKYKLADQEGYAKKLMVLCVHDQFFISKVGSPCGDKLIAEFTDVNKLLDFVRQY